MRDVAPATRAMSAKESRRLSSKRSSRAPGAPLALAVLAASCAACNGRESMTQVKLLAMSNFNAWQTAKAEEARKLIEQTVSSKPFQQAVLEAKFLDVRLEKADGKILANLSNDQVLKVILEGAEQGAGADGGTCQRFCDTECGWFSGGSRRGSARQ
jgi:hypothetical protein